MKNEGIFLKSVRALAEVCEIPQFRCELFDENNQPGSIIASGNHACKQSINSSINDGRCSPGGAAALLRSLTSLQSTASEQEFTSMLRNATKLTFDTDEQFEKMFPSTAVKLKDVVKVEKDD